MSMMNTLEKRDYIHSHLHQIDEKAIDEMFEKLRFLLNEKESVIGYDVRSGTPISRSEFRKEINKRDADIEAGNYITHEDLKKASKKW
jgi:hypothetical protein